MTVLTMNEQPNFPAFDLLDLLRQISQLTADPSSAVGFAAVEGSSVGSLKRGRGRGSRRNGCYPAKYRTALCRHYEEKGECPFGPECAFAHGEAQLNQAISDRSSNSSDD